MFTTRLHHALHCLTKYEHYYFCITVTYVKSRLFLCSFVDVMSRYWSTWDHFDIFNGRKEERAMWHPEIAPYPHHLPYYKRWDNICPLVCDKSSFFMTLVKQRFCSLGGKLQWRGENKHISDSHQVWFLPPFWLVYEQCLKSLLLLTSVRAIVSVLSALRTQPKQTLYFNETFPSFWVMVCTSTKIIFQRAIVKHQSEEWPRGQSKRMFLFYPIIIHLRKVLKDRLVSRSLFFQSSTTFRQHLPAG